MINSDCIENAVVLSMISCAYKFIRSVGCRHLVSDWLRASRCWAMQGQSFDGPVLQGYQPPDGFRFEVAPTPEAMLSGVKGPAVCVFVCGCV
jgi:hypothetical protein